MSYEYRFNCGQYVLHRDGNPITAPSDTVAIALSLNMEVMLKHGSPSAVSIWVTLTKDRLIQGGQQEMADDIIMIEGRFPLDKLNRCLTTTGYAIKLYREMMEMTPEPYSFS